MIRKTSLIFLVFFLGGAIFSYPQEDRLVFITEGKYFSIWGHKGLDIFDLLEKINFKYLIHLQGLNNRNYDDPSSLLAQTLDALYLEVSDILDIHIYSFHGDIKIFPSSSEVRAVYKENFGTDFPERSFYFHQKNTIYISYQDITLGMLGHEIAHAIISHYFVVPPPAKVQEILCGYVEYRLRKSTGTLN